MKKVLFLIVLIVLSGGAWYLNQGTKSGGENTLEKAIEIMKNMQSRALTEDNIAILEQVYQDSEDRIPQITTLRDADITKLKKLLADNAVTDATIATRAASGGQDALVPDDSTNPEGPSKTFIEAKLLGMTTVPATEKTKIRNTYNSAKALSREIFLRKDYISTTAPSAGAVATYGYWRKNICTTTDSALDLYIKGAVTPKPNIATFTAKTDTCTGTTLKQYKCVNNQYIANADYEKTDTCENGCGVGVCLKGKILSVEVVEDDTTTAPAATDIKLGEEFYLKVNARRITSSDVMKVVTTWTNPTGGACTLASSSQTITASGNVFFGPIICDKNGAPKFTVSLQDAQNVNIGASEVEDVAIGASLMDSLVISAVSTAPFRKNTEIKLKVTAKGTNGLNYANYTDNLIFQVTDTSGTTNADDLFPFKSEKLGGAEKEFIFKFASAGERIVKVRGGTKLEASFPITIVD